MHRISIIIFLNFFGIICYGQNQAIKNASIWNGEKMIKKDIYIIDTKLSYIEPAEVDTTIDYSGKFIVPAFGDFHTHLFDGEYSIKYDSLFISKGLFYTNDLVNNPDGRDEMKSYFNETSTVDVSYANGCLTSNYGHPIEGYERMRFNFGWNMTAIQKDSLKESRFYENKTYYIVDNEEQVNVKIDMLESTNPNFIKIILFNSEEYLQSDTIPLFNKGLNPKLLPLIVERANSINTRIVAHVESEFDLLVCMQAGIKYFAHLPQYGFENSRDEKGKLPIISDNTLFLMKMNNVKVNPTLSRTFSNLMYLPEQYRPDSISLKKIKDFHQLAIRKLKEYDIPILSGADFPNLTAVDEILYYNELNIFEPKELLNILINTSIAIFPNRKIGFIEEGFEANFLVLNQDPLLDIKAIKTIESRFKAGKKLNKTIANNINKK
ncbi:amidohydrolase family protein [Muriicola sp.]|uniref:amidohydrolase family protein n=1 Tax=Muriicola sp. TaxID=2020856 RepID=UPI003C7753C5